MREILRNRKWQLFSLVLAIALIISIGFNVYQSFNTSNQCSNGDASGQMNFTFTWGPDNQKIVQGMFRLEITVTWGEGDNVSMVIKANDDEYNEWDYIGLVFDTNQNGHIDLHDEAYGLFANNMTLPSILCEHGFLGFAECPPRLGPQKVSFNPDAGYTFTVQFPYLDEYAVLDWNPAQSLRKGYDNPLHLCFHDEDAAGYTSGVFVRFLFYIPEG